MKIAFSKGFAKFVDQAVIDKYTREKKTHVKIPWGHWDINGKWFHNHLLDMSKEEQQRQNLKNGYVCDE